MKLNPLDFKDPQDYTRDDLINLCERAVVRCSEWRDRDSYSCQVNIQECYDYLSRGYDYTITIESDRTVWIAFNNVTKTQLKNDSIHWLSIDDLDDYREWCDIEGIEYGEMFDSQRYIEWDNFKTYFNNEDENDPLNFEEIYQGHLGGYIPTEFRLAEADGGDWY